MKTLINSFRIGLMLVAVFSLYSCEKRSMDNIGNGTAEFSIALPEQLSLSKSDASGDSSAISYQIIISVEDMDGNAVFTDKIIPVYLFGSGFVSENVELRAGEFRLTKFMIINPAGEVIYAAPLAGSPLAYLTLHPLPLGFNIFPSRVTRVVPEVLAVGNLTPDQFGYATFGIQIIKPLTFWTAAVIDNPLSMAPFPQFTEAKLTVTAMDGWHYSFRLSAGLNKVTVRGGSDIYTLLIEKEGYKPVRLQVKMTELMAATKENPLYLMIPWDSWTYQTLVLQPGPEEGKDAMISNLEPDKNFGDHKYFEATFITEPVLTVMRTNNSLISFNLNSLPQLAKIQKVILRLSYEFPLLYDSTVITNQYFAWFGGVLQQVVEPWEENQVTWNKKPKTIEANQVMISPFIRNVNFIDVDVTRLFVPVNEIAAPNHGMLFRQWPSDQFPGFRFASSDYPEAAMRPKLTIRYTL